MLESSVLRLARSSGNQCCWLRGSAAYSIFLADHTMNHGERAGKKPGGGCMMAKVRRRAIVGLDGALVEVEVDIGHGLPSFTIVGLPDAAVQESRERVRAALKNSGAIFPMKRLTVNLAPADLRKEGPAYDLPIAVAILLASEQASADVSNALFLGELSLDGNVRFVALARNLQGLVVYPPARHALEAAQLGEVVF